MLNDFQMHHLANITVKSNISAENRQINAYDNITIKLVRSNERYRTLRFH